MSRHTPAARPAATTTACHIAIVASRYNEDFVNAMLEAARDEVETVMPNATLAVYRVPGAFEIPVTVEMVLRQTETDVVIALGVIIRGATEHADLVGASVTDALQRIAISHTVPVIHEVLLVNDENQARERTMGEDLNRGREAARTAISMATLFQKTRAAHSK
jgi:6,7-dimethyl-8-ribityllumazine synthase